jgi:HAD superfamily hydrolase (TIGR01509 family)
MDSLDRPRIPAAFLFDLDGTLVNAAQWHEQAFLAALSWCAGIQVTELEHSQRFNGLSTQRKLQILAAEGRLSNDKALWDTINQQKQLLTVQYIEKYCHPITRVTDTVAYAESLAPVGLVTNCSRYTTEMMLERAHLKQFMSVVVTNEDVGEAIKPSPFPYQKAAHLLYVPPKNCLVVEDSPKGIQSAREAGCYVWELSSFEDLNVRTLFDHISRMRGKQC